MNQEHKNKLLSIFQTDELREAVEAFQEYRQSNIQIALTSSDVNEVPQLQGRHGEAAELLRFMTQLHEASQEDQEESKED